MMKFPPLLFCLLFALPICSQDVKIDGRLQPLLNDFFAKCDLYQIPYHDKLFELKSIDIVNTLTVSEEGSVLGMLRRNESGEVTAIDINWMAQLDSEILKVVAFHEFAHYFLEYSEHTCQDCGHIMSIVNSSYFEIVQDWEEQVRILFEESPAYIKKHRATLVYEGFKNP